MFAEVRYDSRNGFINFAHHLGCMHNLASAVEIEIEFSLQQIVHWHVGHRISDWSIDGFFRHGQFPDNNSIFHLNARV